MDEETRKAEVKKHVRELRRHMHNLSNVSVTSSVHLITAMFRLLDVVVEDETRDIN